MTNSLTLKLRSLSTVAVAGFLLPLMTVSAQTPQFNFEVRSPLGEIDTAEEIIVAVLNALVIIAIPIIVLMIIYAGFLYITARGNAEQLRTATTALTYATIGGVLIIGAVAITGIIGSTVGEFTR